MWKTFCVEPQVEQRIHLTVLVLQYYRPEPHVEQQYSILKPVLHRTVSYLLTFRLRAALCIRYIPGFRKEERRSGPPQGEKKRKNPLTLEYRNYEHFLFASHRVFLFRHFYFGDGVQERQELGTEEIKVFLPTFAWKVKQTNSKKEKK